MEKSGSGLFALTSAISTAFLFVISVYAWPSHRIRDHPETIKRRFISVIVVNIFALILLAFCTDFSLEANWFSNHFFWNSIFQPLFTTSMFFLGPLVAIAINCRSQRTDNYARPYINLIILRNYVIAPITEEITFRLVINNLLRTHFSCAYSSLISSILFSISHLHHYFLSKYTGLSVHPASILAQLVFTFLFALYASTIYFRSGSIVSAILIHSFCNFLEFPDFDLLFSSKLLSAFTFSGLLLGIRNLYTA